MYWDWGKGSFLGAGAVLIGGAEAGHRIAPDPAWVTDWFNCQGLADPALTVADARFRPDLTCLP